MNLASLPCLVCQANVFCSRVGHTFCIIYFLFLPVSFSDLPLEIILKILSFLSPRELLQARKVCSLFLELSEDASLSPWRGRSIDLRLSLSSVNYPIVQAASSPCPRGGHVHYGKVAPCYGDEKEAEFTWKIPPSTIGHICLDCTSGLWDSRLLPRILRPLLKPQSSSLVTIHFGPLFFGLDQIWLLKLLIALPCLQAVESEWPVSVHVDRTSHSQLNKLPLTHVRLHWLDIENIFEEDPPPRWCSTVKRLELSFSWLARLISLERQEAFWSLCVALEEVTFPPPRPSREVPLFFRSLRSIKGLTSLRLMDMDDDEIARFNSLEYVPNVQRLHFSFMREIKQYEQFCQFIDKFRDLQAVTAKMWFPFPPLLTSVVKNQHVYELMRGLTLHGCKEEVLQFIITCPSLHSKIVHLQASSDSLLKTLDTLVPQLLELEEIVVPRLSEDVLREIVTKRGAKLKHLFLTAMRPTEDCLRTIFRHCPNLRDVRCFSGGTEAELVAFANLKEKFFSRHPF